MFALAAYPQLRPQHAQPGLALCRRRHHHDASLGALARRAPSQVEQRVGREREAEDDDQTNLGNEL